MLIDKTILALGKLTGPKDGARPAIEYVKITKNCAVATDGHLLARVMGPGPHNIEEFPGQDHNEPTIDEVVYLSGTDCETISKKLPKKSSLPILQNALICKNGDKAVKVVITDLDTTQSLEARKPDITYPNYEAVYPTNEPVIEIGLMVDVLDRLVKFLKATDTTFIKLSIHNPETPIQFRNQVNADRKIDGLIMPARVK